MGMEGNGEEMGWQRRERWKGESQRQKEEKGEGRQREGREEEMR